MCGRVLFRGLLRLIEVYIAIGPFSAQARAHNTRQQTSTATLDVSDYTLLVFTYTHILRVVNTFARKGLKPLISELEPTFITPHLMRGVVFEGRLLYRRHLP